jgi:hypothetical protein
MSSCSFSRWEHFPKTQGQETAEMKLKVKTYQFQSQCEEHIAFCYRLQIIVKHSQSSSLQKIFLGLDMILAYRIVFPSFLFKQVPKE